MKGASIREYESQKMAWNDADYRHTKQSRVERRITTRRVFILAPSSRTCNEFHKDGKVGAEPFSLFTKEWRFGDASWVHAAEGDPC
jgi:hypothetical protein